MADPIYIATLKLPITEKPLMQWSEASMTYTDIFNIQNTIKLLIVHLVEEAPQDGKAYVRKDGKWEELTP